MKRTVLLLAAGLPVAVSACGASSADGGTAGTASCTDATGDGGSADIVSVDLAEDDGDLRTTFDLTEPPNTSEGTLLLSITAWSADGEAGRQLGIKWIDGEPEAFAFDFVTTENEYLEAEPVVDGSSVSITFPEEAIEGLGDTWRWSAATNVDGGDVDGCPEPGTDPMDPERQTFPSA